MGVFSSDISSGSESTHGRNSWAFVKKLGVSVLFSGAAVGVSHVVQSTRAGAEFGFALVPVVLICLFLKYPAFLFGPLYTGVTGESVIFGYSRVGRWTLPVVGLSFLSVMFTVVAAVGLLAAGLLAEVAGLEVNIVLLAIGLIVLSTVLSLYTTFGNFQSYMKWVFVILFVMSLVALLVAVPSFSWQNVGLNFNYFSYSPAQIFFIAALVGWMPAGLDLPMMHSQWILSDRKSDPGRSGVADFKFGYMATGFLAFLFLLIGALLIFGSHESMPASARGFSSAILGVYRETYGWLGGVVMGITLFLAIFSSLAAVVDGFPRVLAEILARFFFPNNFDQGDSPERLRQGSAWIQALGAIAIVIWFSGSLRSLVDFATTVSFFLAPLFAVFNHLIVRSKLFRQSAEVPKGLQIWSLVGILAFTTFTFFYAYLRVSS